VKRETDPIGAAWYRNRWPWFIVILLAVSVGGSLATVVIAYRHRDIDVRRIPIARDATPSIPSRPVPDRIDASREPGG
jgi:hypothetical protein